MDQFQHHRRALLFVALIVSLYAAGIITHSDATPALGGFRVVEAAVPWLLAAAWLYLMFVYCYYLKYSETWRQAAIIPMHQLVSKQTQSIAQQMLTDRANSQDPPWATNGFSHKTTLSAWRPRVTVNGKLQSKEGTVQNEDPFEIPRKDLAPVVQAARREIYITKGAAWEYIMPPTVAVLGPPLCWLARLAWDYSPAVHWFL